jgi:hypothetical protein
MGILLHFIYPAHHPHETQHFPHPSPQKAYYMSTLPPIKTKPASWSFVYSSTIATPQILATTSVGCCYWILPLTYMHLEDATLPIFKSSPSCSPQSQYSHAPLPATHHHAAVPPPIDSGPTTSTTIPRIQGWQVLFEPHPPQHPPPSQDLHPDVPTSYEDSVYHYSTAPYSPSTSDQGIVDGIQTNRCHFGSHPPPIEIKKRYQTNCAECTCSHRHCVLILPSNLECTGCWKMHHLCFFQISCK